MIKPDRTFGGSINVGLDQVCKNKINGTHASIINDDNNDEKQGAQCSKRQQGSKLTISDQRILWTCALLRLVGPSIW
jgi:hypothetical protein